MAPVPRVVTLEPGEEVVVVSCWSNKNSGTIFKFIVCRATAGSTARQASLPLHPGALTLRPDRPRVPAPPCQAARATNHVSFPTPEPPVPQRTVSDWLSQTRNSADLAKPPGRPMRATSFNGNNVTVEKTCSSADHAQIGPVHPLDPVRYVVHASLPGVLSEVGQQASRPASLISRACTRASGAGRAGGQCFNVLIEP